VTSPGLAEIRDEENQSDLPEPRISEGVVPNRVEDLGVIHAKLPAQSLRGNRPVNELGVVGSAPRCVDSPFPGESPRVSKGEFPIEIVGCSGEAHPIPGRTETLGERICSRHDPLDVTSTTTAHATGKFGEDRSRSLRRRVMPGRVDGLGCTHTLLPEQGI
jgi:hypothetical protein